MLLVSALASPTAGEAATPFERWVEARGALQVGPAQLRAERILRSVHPCLEATPLRVHVLDSRAVGAFAWPQGDIVVTTALLDLLDDDELAAALAHEVGHLISDGHIRFVAALVGTASHHESEAAADELGIRLLADGGRNPGAMTRMLEKVRVSQRPDQPASRALDRRLQLLYRNR